MISSLVMSTLKKRRRRQKKIELYLVNDSMNSFQYVIDVLSNTLPDCTSIRAEQLATITHHNGHCHIYTGKSPEVYYIQTILIKNGLHVITRLANTDTNKNLFN